MSWFSKLGYFSKVLIFAFILYPNFIYSQYREKVIWQSLDWKVIHTAHFDIHYPAGYEFLGKKGVEIAEAANLYISEKLRHDLGEVIPVYLYPSPGHFQMTNIIPSDIGEGIGGLTESVHKRIIVPYSGSYDELRHTLTHEIVHAFQYDLILGNDVGELVGVSSSAPSVPIWLIEGMAEYYSIGWDSMTDMIMRDAVLTNTIPSIQDMTEFRIITPIILYKGGQSVLQYVALAYGENKVPELLRDCRDQRSLQNAIKTNFAVSLEEFNKGWQLWLKRLYFDDVNKKSSFETARQGTSHLQDKSLVNMYPAISPDGKKIAYISIRNYVPVIIMRDAESFSEKNYNISSGGKPPEKVVLISGESEEFYQLHLLDNNISFSSDSRNIFFAARSYGKDVLYLYDYSNKKVVKSWAPDVDMIQYPNLSNDGKKAVFVGSQKGKSDIYVLNLDSGNLDRITADYFAKKSPAFSIDDKTVYYSGNQNDAGNIENSDYDIFAASLQTRATKRLLALKGNQEKPRVVKSMPDTIFFISDHDERFNAYMYDMTKSTIKPVTDSFGGILSIEPDEAGKDFILSVYNEQGYDVAILNKKDFVDKKQEIQHPKTEFIFPNFPLKTGFIQDLKPERYKPKLSMDMLYFGLEYSDSYGFGGFAFLSMTDYMGDHRLTGIFDFVAAQSQFNFNLDYALLKYRTSLHAGLFRATSYYSLINFMDLASINNIIYDPNQFTESLYRIGGYLKAVYPWTNFLSTTGGLAIYKYQETFRGIAPRLNIDTNVFGLSAAMNFNNALYSFDGPLKGTYFDISDMQTLNISGSDYVYNTLTVDYRKYFNFFDRYVFAVRAMGGVVSGPQKAYFPFLLGGPFTMRGYDFLSMEGIYTALVNLELRFPMIDYIVFGFPVQWIIRGFTMVAFMDIGTAFSDISTWMLYDKTTGTLRDLKTSFGLGIRVLLVPGIALRFDWATPWDLKTSLPFGQWKFNFSLGYEY
ncbi:MAG: BamA/TamA family outer membrane protein [Spirochaetia bacterium]|nr:BamA/TamA family outer membrane protein [Spirochaetia bacterium]